MLSGICKKQEENGFVDICMQSVCPDGHTVFAYWLGNRALDEDDTPKSTNFPTQTMIRKCYDNYCVYACSAYAFFRDVSMLYIDLAARLPLWTM